MRVPTGLNLQLGVRGGRPNQQSRHLTGFNAPRPPRATAARSAQAPGSRGCALSVFVVRPMNWKETLSPAGLPGTSPQAPAAPGPWAGRGPGHRGDGPSPPVAPPACRSHRALPPSRTFPRDRPPRRLRARRPSREGLARTRGAPPAPGTRGEKPGCGHRASPGTGSGSLPSPLGGAVSEGLPPSVGTGWAAHRPGHSQPLPGLA